MNSDDIEHGQILRDRVTTFEGIVISISEHLTGCTRVGLRPHTDDQRCGEEQYFYPAQLEDTGERMEIDAPSEDIDPSLGDRARDTVTGREGIVSIIGRQAFNCTRVYLSPSVNTDYDDAWVDAPRVTVTEGAVVSFDDEQQSDVTTDSGSTDVSFDRGPTM